MGARPYNPTTGRFLSVDPIPNGSLNNYDYAGQNPINGYDLSGLSMWCGGGGKKNARCKNVKDGSKSVCEWHRTAYTCYTGIALTRKERKAGAQYAFVTTASPVGGSWGHPDGNYVVTVGYRSGEDSWYVPPTDHTWTGVWTPITTAIDVVTCAWTIWKTGGPGTSCQRF